MVACIWHYQLQLVLTSLQVDRELKLHLSVVCRLSDSIMGGVIEAVYNCQHHTATRLLELNPHLSEV